jgi:hypothetical protein
MNVGDIQQIIPKCQCGGSVAAVQPLEPWVAAVERAEPPRRLTSVSRARCTSCGHECVLRIVGELPRTG